MSRFNTGNPLGSGSPLDLDDNAKNMDEAANSSADTFQDRLGKSRLTWAGIVKAGSGDPAIAVDAAANAVDAADRAESAESSVEQNAGQIAQDAAQQAVDSVVIAVDGAVDRAENAADRAETASVAAFVNADVYPDVATGRAAVADGEQFQVVEGEEIVRYRRDGASTATPVARLPNSSAYHQIQVAQGDGAMFDYFRENLFTEEHYTTRLPFAVYSGSVASFVERRGLPCIKLKVAEGGSGGLRWSFPSPDFIAGTKVTFGIEVVSSQASTGSSFIRLNWTGDNPQTDQKNLDFSGITEPRWYTVTTTVPDGVISELQISLFAFGDASNWQRETVVTKMMLIEGETRAYVPIKQPLVTEVREQLAVTQGDGVFVGNFSPNLFTEDYYTTIQPVSVVSDGTAEIALIDGVPSIRVVSRPTTGEGGASWTFTAPELPSDKVTIGFQITRSDPSTNYSLLRIVWNGDFANRIDTSLPFAGIDKPQWYTVTMDRPSGNISSLSVVIMAGGDSSNRERETIITKMMLIGIETDAYVPFTVSSAADGGDSSVYLSTNGSDTNTGSQSSPLATLGEAVRRIGGSGSVVVESGDYPGSAFALAASSVVDLKILGRTIDVNTKRPRVRFGTKVSGAVLESGKVYSSEVPIGTSNADSLHWIWQDGVEDASAIPEEWERHSYYRGRNSRLPCTKIWYVEASDATEAIGVINAASGPSFWYDFSAGKLYFSVAGGGDATLADVWIPESLSTLATFIGDAGRGGSLEIHNLELFYASATSFRGFGRVVATNTLSLGNRSVGFRPSCNAKFESCESAGHGSFSRGNAGGDGWGISDNGNVTLMGCWAHDNNGDGESSHNHCTIEAYMCISEFNGYGGFIPASGAHAVYFGCTSRKNGWQSAGRGGFCIVGGPLDDGVDTTMECYGCTAIDEKGYGFGKIGGATHAKVFDSVVLRATGTAFAVDEISNCRESGSGAIKYSYTVVNNADLVV